MQIIRVACSNSDGWFLFTLAGSYLYYRLFWICKMSDRHNFYGKQRLAYSYGHNHNSMTFLIVAVKQNNIYCKLTAWMRADCALHYQQNLNYVMYVGTVSGGWQLATFICPIEC